MGCVDDVGQGGGLWETQISPSRSKRDQICYLKKAAFCISGDEGLCAFVGVAWGGLG